MNKVVILLGYLLVIINSVTIAGSIYALLELGFDMAFVIIILVNAVMLIAVVNNDINKHNTYPPLS